jgi:hypothetical protein
MTYFHSSRCIEQSSTPERIKSQIENYPLAQQQNYLSASLFFITVKSTETLENSFSQQNVDQQNSKQKRLCWHGVFVIGLLIFV